MKKITLYTWPTCPYCNRAKQDLEKAGYEYNDINIYGNDEMKQKLTDATGQSTVPYIFLDNKLLGGYNDLHNAMTTGRFDEMMGRE